MKKPFFQLLFCSALFCAHPLAATGGDTVPGQATPGAGSDSVQVSKMDIPGIYNFSRTEGGTGFGGATEPTALPELHSMGYRTVINLRLADEDGVDVAASREAARQAGLSYIHLPFDSANPDPDFFTEFLAAVDAEGNQPVYIHCGSATRVAALWMTRRVIEEGWDMQTASEEASAIAGKPEAAVSYATGYIEKQRE